MWRSRLVEILRFAEEESSLRRGDQYLITRDGEAAREFKMPLGDDDALDFLDDLREELHQMAPTRTEEHRRATQKLVVGTVSKMLHVRDCAEPLQVDLVVNAREVAALPLEAAVDERGAPLFVGRNPPVLLTRRIRGSFAQQPTRWPVRPRVLFVYAQPQVAVPAAQHEAALLNALEPWFEPFANVPGAYRDVATVIDKLPDATLPGIAASCCETAYTHVHILAHGTLVASGRREKWGLALHDEQGEMRAVSAEELAAALCSGPAPPAVVTLTACDSGNAGATSIAGASPAHALHAAGVNVVLGSQLPMTVDGSTVLVESFYRALLTGADVRDAIQRTRDALYADRVNVRHDWLSLAAYVRLPIGYEDQLLDVALEADLAAMDIASGWGEHVARQPPDPDAYATAVAIVEERIGAAESRLAECEHVGRIELVREARGLRASAYKRFAELQFRQSVGTGDTAAASRSREALERARRCYAEAAKGDLGSHWLGVQALSLELVLDGRCAEPWRWDAAMSAADAERVEGWAWGSRAELWLLAERAAHATQPGAAGAALERLVASAGGDARFWQSTRRQLRRYVDWWTTTNGFFGGGDDVAAQAAALIAAVEK